MNVSKHPIKRILLGDPDAKNGRYLAVILVLSVAVAGVSYLFLPDGWWSPPGPTNGLLLSMAFVGVVAGYKQYGLLPGVVATSLLPLALLLSGAYYNTTLEYPPPPPPTPIEHVSRSVTLAVVPGILVGVLGYALGCGLRAATGWVRSASSAI